MALALTASIYEKTNVVLPLAVSSGGATVRLAALTTDRLGAFTVTGNNDVVTWSLVMQPPFLSIEEDPSDNKIAYVKFSGPSATTNVYQCYVQADDGQTKVKFPLAIEVAEPFYFTVSGRTDNYQAYDSTAPNVLFTAIGLNDLPVTDGFTQFIAPPDLPMGLHFMSGNGNTAELMVDPPTPDSIAGGMMPSTPASYTFLAYRPGSMYDTVDRAFKRTITIGTLSEKIGSLNSAFSCYWDSDNEYFAFKIHSDYLSGTGLPYEYLWTLSGFALNGTYTTPGSTQDYFNWTPPATGSGVAIFQLKIVDSINKTVLQTDSISIPVDSATEWTSNLPLRIRMDAPYKSGYVGHTVSFTVYMDSSDMNVGEPITVTPTITAVGGVEPTISTPSSFILTQASPSSTISFTIPDGSPVRGKWLIDFNASNLLSPERTGKAQAVLISGGNAPFAINNNALLSLTQTTGSSITPVPLVASDLTNLELIPDADFYLVNAPAGLSIQNNTIVGSVPMTGLFNFRLMAYATGYTPSFSNLSLEVVASDKRFNILSFYSEYSQIQDNTQFHLFWGTTGTPKTFTVQKNSDRPQSVLGATEATESIYGTSVFGLVGSDYRGKVYSSPVLILSSNTTGYTKLPSSPTIATIDKSNIIHINWTPEAVSDSYAYYRGWNIQVKKDGGSAQQLLDASLNPPTGLALSNTTNDSRIYTQQLLDGEYQMSMQPLSSARTVIEDGDFWPEFYAFPGKIDAGTVVLDKKNLKIKEPLTIKMASVYGEADFWRISYSDGTTTGWLPITSKTQSKLFSTYGEMTITVEFEKDYLLEDPKVKLRRSTTFSVYVQNEVYNSSTVGVIGTANVGLGGEAGFEIADSTNIEAIREPYEVIVKALVKDDITQELKMLVATSRTDNASSVLNTMAADVFPLAGRPHLKDLVLPALNLNSDMTLTSPVAIATDSLPDAVVGQPLSEVKLMATGGTEPYDWYSDSLPFGVKLAVDGTLSGTPLEMGVYNINFAVKDSTSPSFIAETSIQMTIKSNLGVANTLGVQTGIEDATVGTFYQHKFSAVNGLGPYLWGLESGHAPLGLSLDTHTGVLSGYPVSYNSDEDFDTPFTFVIEVTDSSGSKASSEFKMNLLPMDLTIGHLDQTVIAQGDDYKLAIPVFGGRSPYSITNFVSDGAVGNVLSIVSPETVDAVSGLGTPALTIMTGDQIFSPSAYPYQAVFPLFAVGGTAPYTWTLNTSRPALNTVTNPVVSASQAAGTIEEDGNTSINIMVTDANGVNTSKIIYLNSMLKAGSGGSGNYSLEYVTIKKNSTYIKDWTFTKIDALPDVTQGASYRPNSTDFYGIAVWNPSLGQMYDMRSQSQQIQMKYLYSKVGGVGQGYSTPLVITARSISWALPKSYTTSGSNNTNTLDMYSVTNGTYTIYDSTQYQLNYGSGSKLLAGTGSTAISQVYFESLGAVAPDGTPYPDNWQAIDNDQIVITQPNLGSAMTGTWTWTIGDGTTLPSAWWPQFINSDGVQGATITSSTGYVRLVPTTVGYSNFQPLATAKGNPYLLQIVATDSNSNSYTANLSYYMVSGGSVRKRGTTWRDGAILLWPDGTAITYTSPFSKSTLGGLSGGTYYGDYVVSGAVATSTSATTTVTGGTTVSYFPMGVTYYEGDYLNKASIRMTTGDNLAFTPVAGTAIWDLGYGKGNNPYSFVILNDTGTSDPNAKISTLGNYTLGTVVTDNNLSKEMLVHCSVSGGGPTDVVAVTSISGDTLPHTWDTGYYSNAMYADWFYILKATGGTAPYTYKIVSGTTLDGVSVHNGQTTTDLGIQQAYTGDFLTLSYAQHIFEASKTYYVNVVATDSNGISSDTATIPFLFVPTINTTTSSNIQVVSFGPAFGTTGYTFYLNASPVENAAQYLTLNTPATFTLSGSLPQGVDLQSAWGGDLMHSDVATSDRVASITASSVKLVGTPTGSPSTTSGLTLHISKPGYSSIDVPININVVAQSATISLVGPGVATPGVYYSYVAGSPLVKLSCVGLPSGLNNRPGLACSFGTLGNGFMTNIVSHYYGADQYDIYFDYYADRVGSATLTLINAGSLTGSAVLPVQAGTLTISGTTVAHTVSEYMTIPFTVSTPPVSISGGAPPYTVSALSVSDTSHFYVQNGQFYMDMSKVMGGNTYTTNVAYSATDSAGTTAYAIKQATVSVRVLAESYVTANFLNKTLTIPDGEVTYLNIPDLLIVQLGHAPFKYYVDSVTYTAPEGKDPNTVGTVTNWFIPTATSRRFAANRSTNSVTLTDLSDQNVITQAIGGGNNLLSPQLVNLSGENTSLVSQANGTTSTIPATSYTAENLQGTYYLTLKLRVVDSLGISTTGTSIVTLIVP